MLSHTNIHIDVYNIIIVIIISNINSNIVSAFASPADPGIRTPGLGDGALLAAS